MANEEERVINQLALLSRGISGLVTAYDFAAIPDSINSVALPAAVFWPEILTPEKAGHTGIYRNKLIVRGSYLVVARMAKGGTIKYLDNAAIPFMSELRRVFQNSDNIRSLLALGVQKAELSSATYGAGGRYLTHAGIEYVGVAAAFTISWTS